MSSQLLTLEAMPTAIDFYGQYWNKRPFVVHGAIDESILSQLVSADELAALSMEEDARSRLINCTGEPKEWTCRQGPFSEHDLTNAHDSNWSLMIQNVEQFHTDTADLLSFFSFAPRWLMDDIMVSFSAPGGTVGPHIDSYHVFLVQGDGKRRWNVSREPVTDEDCIPHKDIKVLSTAFDGDTVELNSGDVLYVPPRFGHEGVTLESAMTYSVGFLGPRMSDLFSAYSQYLSENEDIDPRYIGDGIDTNSAGFTISDDTASTIRTSLVKSLDSDDFTQWLVEFFTESSHEDFGGYTERPDVLSFDAFKSRLNEGASLFRPEYVKLAITNIDTDTIHLGFDAHSFSLDKRLLPLVLDLMEGVPLNLSRHPSILSHSPGLSFLLELYNHQALEFTV